MVARSAANCQSQGPDPAPQKSARAPSADLRPAWKRALADAHRDLPSLLAALNLSLDQMAELDPEPSDFPLLVPRGFSALMRRGDPEDPLLRQVLPLAQERLAVTGFVADPVGDQEASRQPGLIQKYRGRALLMAHGACAVHCRYCFRRHFPYAELGPAVARRELAINAIAADGSLREVILSGGDPLMLDDQALVPLLSRLAALPQIRRLRLHSRLPVVLPERITGELCEALGRLAVPLVLVIHVNHPRELGAGLAGALAALKGAGVTLLNQSVLLKGVNDRTQTLAELSEGLFDQGVLPYYLHQLDAVQGAAHFAVTDTRARRLHWALRARLPGYLVPRLVREFAGDPAKRHLAGC